MPSLTHSLVVRAVAVLAVLAVAATTALAAPAASLAAADNGGPVARLDPEINPATRHRWKSPSRLHGSGGAAGGKVRGKRAAYTSVSILFDATYCSEADPDYSYGPDQPLAADCQALASRWPSGSGGQTSVLGYWSVAAGEMAAAPERWVRLAQQGSCALDVRLSRESHPAVDRGFRFGTNDLGYYLRRHASEGVAQDGRVGAWSPVICRSEGQGQPALRVQWRIVKP
ncbi:hypothetical protein MFIFM68171_09931 [Madurella fahalii]|uniref:Ecp2 effector protein-like domain-containing protein n=1 Tax=Madurella fahalii TaxID=1157608 RepID=A0ABQ0GPS5_9PEZI